MSTHAMYIFSDSDGTYGVYKHHDGYPDGAASHLLEGIKASWALPRFEADEAAASFVAANKRSPGGVRLVVDPAEDNGQEYIYNVFQAKNGQLILKAFGQGQDTPFFYGRLKDFCLNYGNLDKDNIVRIFHGEVDNVVEDNSDDFKAQIDAIVKNATDALETLRETAIQINNVANKQIKAIAKKKVI